MNILGFHTECKSTTRQNTLINKGEVKGNPTHLWSSVFFVVDVTLIVELFVSLDDHIGHRAGLLQSVGFIHLTPDGQEVGGGYQAFAF